MEMENALSIIGFYFTLIGFISGLFFTRLDSWYGKVREFWGEMKLLEKETEKIAASKKGRVTMLGLRESAPYRQFHRGGTADHRPDAPFFWHSEQQR
jgi:hypothetical protein